MRSLTADEISQLPSYEREYSNSPAVVQFFWARLAELAAGQTPSTAADRMERNGPRRPRASPRSARATTALPSFPPPHGTPDQPP